MLGKGAPARTTVRPLRGYFVTVPRATVAVRQMTPQWTKWMRKGGEGGNVKSRAGGRVFVWDIARQTGLYLYLLLKPFRSIYRCL